MMTLSLNAFSQTVTIQGNERSDYIVETLKLALSYSPSKGYQLAFFKENLPKVRVFKNIANNEGIDIIAAGATKDRIKLLHPIYFPIIKGLYGWRIPLVSTKNIDLFLADLSREDFKKLTVGQLHSWSDTKILASNNLPIEKGSHFQGLFDMLSVGRFDYFPRSIVEIDEEFQAHKDIGIAIDSNILIHYPSAYFFYVNKENTELAKDVKFGLEQALKDGSFEYLFMQHFGDIVNRTMQEKRKVYRLQNPFLPSKTPLDRKELWLDLVTDKKIIL